MPKPRKPPGSRDIPYSDRVSQSDAARAIGISQSYISRLVRQGYVDTDADGRVSIREIVQWRSENSILSRGNGQREPSQYIHTGFAIQATQSAIDQAREQLGNVVAACAELVPGEADEARRARIHEALEAWLQDLHSNLEYSLVPDE